LIITRAISADTHIKNSIAVTSAGVLAVIAGTDGTAFQKLVAKLGGRRSFLLVRLKLRKCIYHRM